MKYIAFILSILVGSFSVALSQSNSAGSSAGQSSASSSSPQGAAGTNVSGTVHTNQGNSYGNNASGGPSPGIARTGQPATTHSTPNRGSEK